MRTSYKEMRDFFRIQDDSGGGKQYTEPGESVLRPAVTAFKADKYCINVFCVISCNTGERRSMYLIWKLKLVKNAAGCSIT